MPDHKSPGIKYRPKRRPQHSGKRPFRKIFIWVMQNPLKLIAIICACILIYITALFFLFEENEKTLDKSSTVNIQSNFVK
jgi:hypothetical protein